MSAATAGKPHRWAISFIYFIIFFLLFSMFFKRSLRCEDKILKNKYLYTDTLMYTKTHIYIRILLMSC